MGGGGDFLKDTLDFITTPGALFGAEDRASKKAREANEQAAINKANVEAQALLDKQAKIKVDAEAARLKELQRVQSGVSRSTNILTSALGLLNNNNDSKNDPTLLS